MSRLCAIIAILGCVCAARAALTADELLLITNKNLPASAKCAEFYKNARHVPDGRILELDLPGSDELTFDQYEQKVVPAVRSYLRKHELVGKVRCLVMFYGVPIRIGSHKATPVEQQEIESVKTELADATTRIEPLVQEAERFAREISPTFKPRSGAEVGERTSQAISAAASGLPLPNDPKYAQQAGRLMKLLSEVAGDVEVTRKFNDEQIKRLAPTVRDRDRWSRRTEVIALEGESRVLQERRWDPASRKQLRELVKENMGLFNYVSLLRSQLQYLQNDGSLASLDNEIALLWWDYYSRAGQQPNPLNWRARVEAHGAPPPPAMMVMRLDGPQEGSVANIVLGSLRAEKDGLQGRFAIDSNGGSAPGGGIDKGGGYKAFDQTLTHLATLVRAYTKIPLTLDQKPQVFQPGTVKDVALYCGWYSVRDYVPAFTFKPGAVGYHIASFEMLSLRNPEEKGWVPGLLNDGIAATMGAVAEPYLAAFPMPDEFFPLLLTGKLTLAEVYWATTPMTSWMISCVGDPLYTPFKVNPQMKVQDLPEEMGVLFGKPVAAGGGQ